MAAVDIQMRDGSVRTAEVDDRIRDLPPADQAAFVARVREHLEAQQVPKDTSFGGALTHGLRQTSDALAATGQVLGEQGGSELAEKAAAFRDSLKAGDNYAPAAASMTENFRQGNYGEALSYLPRAGVESLPDVAAGYAAFKAGKLPGLTAYMLARTGGQNAEQRAMAEGRTRPTGGDVLKSLPATAVDTALGVVGTAAPGAGQIASPLLRGGYRAAAEGVTNAGQELVHQTLTTLGTQKGVTVDPAEIATAGVTGAASRGMLSAGTGAVQGVGRGIHAAGKFVAGEGPTIPNLDAAAAITRIANAAEAVRQSKADDGVVLTDVDALNTYRKDLTAGLVELGRTLKAGNYVDDATYRQAIAPAIDQAARHNSDIYSAKELGAQSAWDRVQALDIPAEAKTTLLNGLRDLSYLSQGGRANRQTGPLEKVGGVAGRAAALITGAAHGGVVGTLGAAGHPVLAAVGKNVGASLDRALGLARPTVIRQAAQARRMLDAAGREAGTSSLAAVDRAREVLNEPRTLADVLDIQAPPKNVMRYSVPDPSAPGGVSHLTRQELLASERYKEAAGRDLERMLITRAKQEARLQEAATTRLERAADQVSGMAYRRDQAAERAAARQAERSTNLRERAADQVSGMAYKKSADALAAREAGFTGMSALTAKRDYGLGTAGAGYDASGRPVPVPSDPVTLAGGRAFVKKVLTEDLGVRDVTPRDISKAIDTLTQADVIPQPIADALKSSNRPWPKDDPIVQSIIAQIAIDKGRREALNSTASAVDPEALGTRGPIRDPQRWQAARGDVKRHVRDLAETAETRGDPQLADTIRKIGAAKEASKKVAIRDAFLQAVSSDGDRLIRAVSLLDDPTLMKGVE